MVMVCECLWVCRTIGLSVCRRLPQKPRVCSGLTQTGGSLWVCVVCTVWYRPLQTLGIFQMVQDPIDQSADGRDVLMSGAVSSGGFLW